MKKLLPYLKKYRFLILVILIFTAIKSVADIMLPTIMAKIVDVGIAKNDVPYIYKAGALMILITLIGGAFSVAIRYYSARVSVLVSKDLRMDIFSKSSRLSFNEIDELGTSTIITRTTNDVIQIENAMSIFFVFAFMAPLIFISTLTIAIIKDIGLTMIIVVATLVISAIILVVFKFSMPIFKQNQKFIDKLNLVVRERLTGIRVIRAVGKSEYEKEKFEAASENLRLITTKTARLIALFTPFIQLLISLVSIALVYFGAIKLDAGTIQIGELMAFLQYGILLMWSILMFSMLFIFLPRAEISLERIMEVIEKEPSISDNGIESNCEARGEIIFKDVDFYYSHSDKRQEAALKDISFILKAGSYNAIIGSTGSGKSTIIKLLQRFYEQNSGDILIDNIEIKDYSNESIRKLISFSPQKTEILSGTVRENIDINGNLSDEEIINALKIADAHEFIEKYDNYLDHELNRSGTNLSGGQKQRLSIARACAKKSSIYIFDDSFSALDMSTEERVKTALFNELKNKTVIVIAQKISSIKNADKILLIDEGKLVDIGTHNELASRCEIYKEIMASQEGVGSYE